MRYYKITYSNNYCGCEEEEYIALEDNVIPEDCIEMETYSYYEDDRFIDADEDTSEEEYWELMEEYQQNCYYEVEEITKEEYEENV